MGRGKVNPEIAVEEERDDNDGDVIRAPFASFFKLQREEGISEPQTFCPQKLTSIATIGGGYIRS